MLDFLSWLFSGAGALAVVSFIAERSSGFQSLDVEVKKMYKTIAATVIALGAYALSIYVPVEFWAMLDPYWKVVLGIIALNYGVEIFHAFDRTLVKN